MQFVEGHVRSLLTWDILVYFHKNPDVSLDTHSLALQLGRRSDEMGPEIEALCDDGILSQTDGLVRYEPPPKTREIIGMFVDSCQDRERRLALIALVLHKITPHTQE
ncbi:MAG: hypothetical protein RBS78_02825 [Coriobacteriia bacterium]|jgi:hypothetical protein|nr:hypothetical protein [Coriobacteriia bacterium]